MELLTTLYNSRVATAVYPVQLTDVDGNNTTVVPVTHARNGNATMRTVYMIENATNGTHYFYADALGQNAAKIADIAVGSSASATMNVSIEYEINGTWMNGGDAYSSATDANLTFTGTAAQRFNTIPVLDPIAGTPMRVKIVLTDVATTTTLYCQALES